MSVNGSVDFSSAVELLAEQPMRVCIGDGRVAELGPLARAAGFKAVLLVTDKGIVGAGHVSTAVRSLREALIEVWVFDGAAENPTDFHVAAGLEFSANLEFDAIAALGGGSAMDCAKAINLLRTNGGRIADYWGINKATHPMLPMIAIPTTAGTGSESQSFALISDSKTHQKMACGDRRLPAEGGLRPRAVILDPNLTATAPGSVIAAAGIDAIAHAVETAGTTAQTEGSRRFSKAAWSLLSNESHGGRSAFEEVVTGRGTSEARNAMLLGAHLAGAAIEQSMLGAAHAAANPLTAQFGITHGVAVGLMLPHVVRFNSVKGMNPYALLDPDPLKLIGRLERFLSVAAMPTRLRDCGVPEDGLSVLSQKAAEQWTAGFNPRRMDAQGFLELYRQAWA